jgi:O-antigen/teichoic acid export membrane protein
VTIGGRTLSRNFIANHLRKPLYQSAYAWAVSTAISSLLGIVYWIVAARFYPPEAVGLNAAILAALFFVSGVSQLNLTSVLLRFVPTGGQATARLVGISYLVTIAVSGLLSGLTILILGGSSATFRPLLESPQLALWVVLGTMSWGVFALQDSALTALRATLWVPVESIFYSLVKIAALLLFSRMMPEFVILASWVAPLVLVILPLNVFIFRHLIPRHVATSGATAEPISGSELASYAGGNYLGHLFTLAALRLLPILVATQVSPQANAYFYMAWTIASSLKLVAMNMTSALTAEGAADKAAARGHSRRFLLMLVALFVPILAIITLAAPLVLRLSGSGYEAQGAAVLRLLTLAVAPSIVTAVYIGLARAQDRTWGVVTVQGALCLVTIGAAYGMLRPAGINGVGLALVASETAIASILLLTELRPLLRRGARRQPSLTS